MQSILRSPLMGFTALLCSQNWRQGRHWTWVNTLCCTFKDTDNIENIWLFKVETPASGNAGWMHPHGHHSCSADGKLVLLKYIQILPYKVA